MFSRITATSIQSRRRLLGGIAGVVAASSVLGSRSLWARTARSIRNQDNKAAKELGFTSQGLDKVASVFSEMIERGEHPGAQLAIYRQGRLILELADGQMEPGGAPVTADTLFQIRSTTKALTTMVMMQAYDRGRFKIDDPVAKYWPEFAANGKEDITIGQVLSHQAGIPDGPRISPAELADRVAVARAVAAMKPIWKPGTANGYHAATIGWISDELMHRLEGKSVEELLMRDIIQPLGLKDLFLGMPRSEFPRMAKMSVDSSVRGNQGLRARFSDFLNTPGGIGLPLSWVAGVSTARALAMLMAIPAHRGTFAGHRYFSAETQKLFSTPTNPLGRDDLRLMSPIHWGLGFILGDTPNIYGSTPRPETIGHAGGGASVAWGDPVSKLSVAFLCNRMLSGGGSSDRYRKIGDAVYGALA